MDKEKTKSYAGSTEGSKIQISVIVPCYNAEENIEDCIKTLLAQSYPAENYEIIMVDNNSTDNTVRIINNYPRIKLLSENKQGSYAARNSGVAESKGSIIAFTDSDCIPDLEWLQIIFESMRSPGIGIIQGGRVYGSDSPSLSLLTAYESERAESTFSGRFTGIYYGYTNNMSVRRDVFERSGPFLEVLRGADSIFVNRAVQDFSSEIIRYVPGAKIRHMEIISSIKYFHKKYLYGRSFQQNHSQRKKTHRDMSLTERYSMIKRTIHRNRFTVLQSIFLVLLIMIGLIYFRFGRLSVTFETNGKWFSERIRKRQGE